MDTAPTYRTLAAAAQDEFKREKSRFIGLADPVTTPAEAGAALARGRARFPDATHHCSAYRLWHGAQVVGHADDDREPLNSAGPPILQVLAGGGWLNVSVVVVRYYGGVKLGVGGLIRAYGDAAKAALAAGRAVVRVPEVRVRIRYPHALTGAVMGVLHRAGVAIEAVSYDPLPEVRATVPAARRAGLARQLQEACAGQAEVQDD